MQTLTNEQIISVSGGIPMGDPNIGSYVTEAQAEDIANGVATAAGYVYGLVKGFFVG